jgi:hypothetical protein
MSTHPEQEQAEEDFKNIQSSHLGKYYDKNLIYYHKVIGDPCYRYNKEVKEQFFKNVYLSLLFFYFIWYKGKDFIAKAIKKCNA